MRSTQKKCEFCCETGKHTKNCPYTRTGTKPAVKPLTTKQRAFWFFYRNAGTSYYPAVETERQGKARGARRLAAAERTAKDLGYWFDWEWDQDGCIGCECGSEDCACSTGKEHECLGLPDARSRGNGGAESRGSL